MENNKVIEIYIQNMKVEQLSDATIDNYTRLVEEMRSIVGKDYMEIKYMDLKLTWMSELSNRNNSNRTINIKIAAVKKLYEMLFDFELLEKNPAEKIKALEDDSQYQRNVWSKEEILKLIDTAKNLRDKALVALLLNTGLRISEVTEMTLEQYQQEVIHVTCKGGVKRDIYLSENTRHIVDEYIAKGRKNSGIDNLLVGNQGKPLRSDNCSATLKKLSAKAGINKNICNHNIRATFATEVIKQHGLSAACSILKHSSPKVTQIYWNQDESETKDIMKNFI